MLAVAAGEKAGFDALATNWQVACEEAELAGTSMDRSRVRCVVTIHLAEDRATALRDIRSGAEEWVQYMNNNQPRFNVPEGVGVAEWLIENEMIVAGTPQDAIDRIERLRTKQGDFGVVLLLINNFADYSAIRRSLELYAQYVIPHFSGANDNRDLSYNWVTTNQAEIVQTRVAAIEASFGQNRQAPETQQMIS